MTGQTADTGTGGHAGARPCPDCAADVIGAYSWGTGAGLVLDPVIVDGGEQLQAHGAATPGQLGVDGYRRHGCDGPGFDAVLSALREEIGVHPRGQRAGEVEQALGGRLAGPLASAERVTRRLCELGLRVHDGALHSVRSHQTHPSGVAGRKVGPEKQTAPDANRGPGPSMEPS